jgi:imidazolonepropionase-like amidohydrolase
MKVRRLKVALPLILTVVSALACYRQSQKVPTEFVISDAPVIALTHVRIIDGTGSRALEDQSILIEAGVIKSITDSQNLQIPSGAKIFDLKDQTAMPGLVGMHEHLFYSTANGTKDVSATNAFPRLYLASGVTTIRTAGTLNLDDDVATRDAIDNGAEPGPKIYLTSPYINRPAGRPLDDAIIDAAVDEWAGKGINSLKVYTNIGRAELRTATNAAHRRGFKVTGHLCAVGYREAIDLGIDNLEHGLIVDTEFYSAKLPDQCPDRNKWLPELASVDVKSQPVQELIGDLVRHRVAITSTLPIFETFVGDKFSLDPRVREVLTEKAYQSCVAHVEQEKRDPRWAVVWQSAFAKEMQFEREFVKAGGLLLTGVDPTGWGGVIAGFGDQRGLELLVAAGFTPLEAIHIATANGAEFLGQADHIGTLAVGKQADIVIVRGNPAQDISAVRNVTAVFKNGVGYDPARLIASVRGSVGE